MEMPLLIFALVTLVSLGCLFLAPRLMGSERRSIKHRLVDEFQPTAASQSNPELFRDLDALAFSPQDEYALLDMSQQARPTSFWTNANTQLVANLNAAGMNLTSGTFLTMSLVLGLCFGGLGWLAARLTGAACGLAFGCVLPTLLMKARVQARRRKFQRQLPSAFELMARVLRTGQSVPQAFDVVVEGFDPPLATEFAHCQRQQALGLPAEVAFQEMANRNAIVELRIFAMSMLIQRQMGGNLADVLERLAALVRQRIKLQQHVRTLTAEGRMQGITLVVLPFLMFVALFFVNRPYALILLEHPALIVTTLSLMGIGMMWIRSIVRVEESS